jgi:hypothetical protein
MLAPVAENFRLVQLCRRPWSTSGGTGDSSRACVAMFTSDRATTAPGSSSLTSHVSSRQRGPPIWFARVIASPKRFLVPVRSIRSRTVYPSPIDSA